MLLRKMLNFNKESFVLIELPLLLEDEQTGIVEQSAITIRIDCIESVLRNDCDIPSCDLNTKSSDCYRINIPYEQMIKFWHDSLETMGGVAVYRMKEKEPRVGVGMCGKANCGNLN